MESKIIVYLEADPDVSKAVSQALKESCFQMIRFTESKNLLENIADLKADLLLFSLISVTSDKWKLAAKMMQTAQTKALPVLVITSKSRRYDYIPGLVNLPISRPQDYIIYPFEPSELCLRIENLLNDANDL